MEENSNRSYSGKICEINGQKVDFRAEIYFDEYKEGVVTIYGITNEVIEKVKCNIHSSAVMLLESKEYISVFNYFVKQQTYTTDVEISGEGEFSGFDKAMCFFADEK